MVIAAMSLVAAFAVAVAPETKDKPMPEDIGDFDAGPLFRCRNKPSNARIPVPLDDASKSSPAVIAVPLDFKLSYTFRRESG